jgi:hypothetical protein
MHWASYLRQEHSQRKVQLYITLIRSIVLYGAQCYTVKKSDESKLRVFERKILRRMYGPCLDQQTGIA